MRCRLSRQAIPGCNAEEIAGDRVFHISHADYESTFGQDALQRVPLRCHGDRNLLFMADASPNRKHGALFPALIVFFDQWSTIPPKKGIPLITRHNYLHHFCQSPHHDFDCFDTALSFCLS
jgi:hypothetical protein